MGPIPNIQAGSARSGGYRLAQFLLREDVRFAVAVLVGPAALERDIFADNHSSTREAKP
jgi:hypothetical protein